MLKLYNCFIPPHWESLSSISPNFCTIVLAKKRNQSIDKLTRMWTVYTIVTDNNLSHQCVYNAVQVLDHITKWSRKKLHLIQVRKMSRLEVWRFYSNLEFKYLLALRRQQNNVFWIMQNQCNVHVKGSKYWENII